MAPETELQPAEGAETAAGDALAAEGPQAPRAAASEPVKATSRKAQAKKPRPAGNPEEAAGEPEPPERTFRLRDATSTEEDGVHRVTLGSDPLVSLGPGETFSTRDEKLAARLAAVEELEELNA
jgi:hypothetical protein